MPVYALEGRIHARACHKMIRYFGFVSELCRLLFGKVYDYRTLTLSGIVQGLGLKGFGFGFGFRESAV